MPRTVSEILTVAEFKQAKGIPDFAKDRDSAIESFIEGAVNQVSKDTGKPLLDVRETQEIVVFGSRYMLLRGYGIQEVTKIQYWMNGRSTNLSPNGFVYPGRYGRLADNPTWLTRRLYPLASGWPESTDCRFLVEVRRGMDDIPYADLKLQIMEAAYLDFSGKKNPNSLLFKKERERPHMRRMAGASL